MDIEEQTTHYDASDIQVLEGLEADLVCILVLQM